MTEYLLIWNDLIDPRGSSATRSPPTWDSTRHPHL